MPLYEYQCNVCSRRFELIQKFSDPLASECPTCGGPVRKLFSSPAIQFKGTGWYVTDYARKGQRDPPTDKDGSGEATSSSASGSTDASKDSGSAPSSDASKDSGSAPSSSAKTSTATGSPAK